MALIDEFIKALTDPEERDWQRFVYPITLDDVDAKRLGMNIQPGWKVRFTGIGALGEPEWEFDSPEGRGLKPWQAQQKPYMEVKPEPLPVAAPMARPTITVPAPVLPPPLPLPDLLEKVLPGITPESVVSDTEGFIRRIQELGRNQDTEAILRDLGASERDIEIILGPPTIVRGLVEGRPLPLDRETLIRRGVAPAEATKLLDLSKLELDSEQWLQKFLSINPSLKKDFVYSLASRSLSKGMAGLVSGVAGVAGVAGKARQGKIQDNLAHIAEVLASSAPPQEVWPVTPATLIDPRFWQTSVMELVPFMVAAVPIAILAAYGGAAAAAVAGIPWLTSLVATLSGGAAAAVFESSIEAGGAYNQAKVRGFTDEEASRVFSSVLTKNVTLLTGTNAVELFAAFMPGPLGTMGRLVTRGWVRATIKGGRLVTASLTEAGQEALQDMFTKQALGEKFEWNDETKMAAMLGGLMGFTVGGAGVVYSTIQSRTYQRLPDPIKTVVDEEIARMKEQGATMAEALTAGLNKVGDEKAVKDITAQVVEEVKKEEAIKQIRPADKVEAFALERVTKIPEAGVPLPAAPEITAPAPEVTAKTHLNLGRAQGTRLFFEEMGILSPGYSQLTISEIVTKLNEIQAKLDKIPTSRLGGPQFRKLDNARITLLKVVERESGLSETGLRNIAEGLPPPIVQKAIPKAKPEIPAPVPEVTVYRGSSAKDQARRAEGIISITTSRSVAEDFAKQRKGKVVELSLSKDVNLISVNDDLFLELYGEAQHQMLREGKERLTVAQGRTYLINKLREQGYNAIDFRQASKSFIENDSFFNLYPNEQEILLFDPTLVNPKVIEERVTELPPQEPPKPPPPVAPRPVGQGDILERARRIQSELEADISITEKKIAAIKTPLPTQGADVGFARLALNDANRLLRQNSTLIKRIEEGMAVSQDEINALTDEVASIKDALSFQVKDVARARQYLTHYIAKNVPLRERGKLLTAVSNIKGAQDIDAVVQRANELAEQSARRTLISEIKEQLKRAVPRKVEGIVKGRFGGEFQSELDIISRSLSMDRDEALSRMSANMQAYDEGRMTYDGMRQENARLQFSGIQGMTVAELQETLYYIKSLKEVGRALRTSELEKYHKGIDAASSEIIKIVSGGKPVEPGTIREFGRFKALAKQVEGGQLALTDFLDILSGTDKTSKPYSSALNLFVDDRVLKSYNAEQDGLVNTQVQVRDNFMRIFGVKKHREANDILRRMGKERIELGIFNNTEGKPTKLVFTKGQMIDAYNLMQAKENIPTLVEGNKYTPEMMKVISDGLTVQEKAWADWQRSFLDGYWEGINAVYEPLYGVNLGRNPNYWPRNRDVERSDIPEHILVQEDYNQFAAVTNRSLKARTQNKIPFKFLDANQKLVNHITQMEHFKSWAFTIRDLRSVFMRNDIKDAIHQFYGTAILGKVNAYINVMARGGIEKAKRNHILDIIRGNVAVATLGVKPGVAMRQPLALLAFATEMPYTDFVTGVTDFLKNPVANYKILYDKSSSLRARYRAGQYERDIKVGVEGGAPRSISGKAGWKEHTLTLTQMGDTFGTVPGMWAKYQSELKAGATDEQAILEAEKLTNRTQNTSQLFTLTTIQHGGSWARLFTMFQDQPSKYFRLINANFRNMVNGRQGVAKSISNIALLWAVIPVLFQWMADGFQWKKERQLRAALLGWAGTPLIFGQVAQSVVGWATGEKYPYQPSPVLEIMDDIKVAISKMRKVIADGRDPFKDISMDDVIDMIEFMVKGVGTAAGVPTPYLVQVEKAIRGQEGKRDWRELVFTRWALEEPKPELRQRLTDAKNQLGLPEELTGEEPPDKVPKIYDTKDYWTKAKEIFSKTLPSDITEKNGFDALSVIFGQARLGEAEWLSLPDKALYKLIDDMEKDETINYSIMQYYRDWQERGKIDSLAKLKEYDALRPRSFRGNLTQSQIALLVQYEGLSPSERKDFLKEHPSLTAIPRQDWLKSHPEENALLALFGQADILTKEAYNQFKALVKDLDIPDSALPEKTLPPEGSIDTHFKYLDMVAEGTHGSWEADLMLLKDPDYAKWKGLKQSETPIASLELKTIPKYHETYDKLNKPTDPDWIGNLDDKVKDKDGLTAKDRASAKLKDTKIPGTDLTYRDMERKVEIIEKGTDAKPIDKKIVDDVVAWKRIADKPGVGSNSAESMLARVDNPGLDAFLTDPTIWTGKKGTDNAPLEPIDKAKIPIWRIDVKYAKEDKEYQAILDANEGREESEATKAYRLTHPEYRKDRRRREAYGLTNSLTGYKFPTTEVENFVAYNELSLKGKRRDRFLVENPKFANALRDTGQIANLPDPAKVPAVQYDDIYDQYPNQFDDIEGNGKRGSKWFIESEAQRKAHDKELRFTPAGKLTDFGIAETRRQAYAAFVPEAQVDNYVGYYSIVKEGRPKLKPDEKDAGWYEDDWFLSEHPDFYKEIYLGVLGNQRKDFRLVPTREVFAKYLTYLNDRVAGKSREDFRWVNPDLEEWLLSTNKVTEPMTLERYRANLLTPLKPKPLSVYEMMVEELRKRGGR